MRKLIVSMNLSLDGFLSGPAGELDWHFQSWTDDMADALGMQLAKADTILMGRITYAAMAGYWQARMRDLSSSRDDIAFAETLNRYAKLVVSGSLTETAWPHTTVMNGDLRERLTYLKRQPGKDIIIYGSGRLVSALAIMGLVDEYLLWIHPVALGSGKFLFGSLQHMLPMRLTSSRTFDSGVVLLAYQCGCDDHFSE